MDDVKMFLFARWMGTCYATHTLNSEDGYWWADKLNHFNEEVYPNYVENGAIEDTKKFLETNKAIKDVINDLP